MQSFHQSTGAQLVTRCERTQECFLDCRDSTRMQNFPRSAQIERKGIIRIATVCAQMGHIWRETSCSDVGFDGEIELVEGDKATGQIIKVQGKAGRSYIRNEKPNGFDFYADSNHLEYWRLATNPVILV